MGASAPEVEQEENDLAFSEDIFIVWIASPTAAKVEVQ